MNFVFPQFLWALTALAIPILVHLFNFRRTTRILFSNNRFLAQIKKNTGYKRSIKQYLILLSRLLFLFFLVLAFAQPFFPAKEKGVNTRNVIFYLDNSLSMSVYTQEQKRAIDVGIEFIREVIKSFPSDTRYKMMTNDSYPFLNSFKSPDKILDELTQIQLSEASLTAEEVRRRILVDEATADVFWISDFQKSTFGPSQDFVADKTTQWHPIPITLAQYSNIYVDSIYLDPPFSINGRKNKVYIKITNTGQTKIDNLRVKLIINDIQSGIATVSVDPNYFAVTSFDLSADMSGLNRVQVSIDDFLVSFDNDFYFALNFTETIRVVEIKSDLDNTYIKSVFGNSKIFSYTGFQQDNVGYDMLYRADLIVLNGLKYIDDSLVAALQNALRNAGALLFIPNENPDLNSYKKLLGLNNLKLGTHSEMSQLDEPDLLNPFFKNVFEEQFAPLKMPRATKLLDWGNDPSAILSFRDTSPFLSQKGNIFLFTSPFKNEYTDFYNHALFVPVMYKIATSAKNSEQHIYHTITENLITIRVDSAIGDAPIKLMGNQEMVPYQHRVRDKVFLEISKFSINSGFYYVTHQQDTLNLLAFNPHKHESDLQSYKPTEIPLLYGDSSKTGVFQTADTKIFINEIKERYLGTPLWRAALLLALLFLLAEVLVIRYFK